MTSGENRPAAELSLDEILDRYEDQDGGGVGHRNPFKFLDSYGPDDLDIFFGREADTEEALRHFYRRKHLVLYGESGSGKTSLVQCGLRGKIAGEDAVFITLRSHRDPWRQLRHAVKTRLPGAGGGHDIPELLRRLADHESCTIVLVFDQFEELFIYHGMKVKQDFARELQKLIDIRLDIKILFIIRQEYLAHLTELEQEVPALFENRLWLRRMSDDDATRAVETACQVCGVGIEPGLAGNIVQRLTSEGSGVELPYLQVVMDRLYHKAVDADDEAPLISAAAYEAEGRIEDILARFLEEEVDALKSPEHGRQILKALVTSEGTKKVVTRDELARDALNYGDELDANEMGLVLRQLVESRILREDPQRETLELRHDTLAATVFAWMTGLEKELLEIRQSLHNRHKEYLARKEAPGALLDTGFLQYLGPYEGRLHLEPDIAVYIQRSHDAAQHQSRRRKRLMFGGFATAFSVLLAFSAWNLAERAKVALLAKGLLVGKLESHAEELSHTRPVVSALLALQILGMSDSGQADVRTRAQSLLRSVLAKLDGTGLGYLDQAVAKVSISPGGERIAVLDAAGAVSHWHRDTRERVQVSRIQLPSASRATNLLLSPDGEQLAIISRDHGVWLQDLAGDTGTVTLRKLGEHTTTIHDLAFSPDGQWLATAGGDKLLHLWPTGGTVEVKPVSHVGANSMITVVAFSADGQWLVSGGRDGSVRVWSRDTALGGVGADQVIFKEYPVKRLAISSKGRWLAVLDTQNELSIWRAGPQAGNQREFRHFGTVSGIARLSFDSDAPRLAVLGEGGNIALYHLDKSTVLQSIALTQEQESELNELRFVPGSPWLVAVGGDRKIRGWRLNTDNQIVESFVKQGHEGSISTLAVSGDTIASGDAMGALRSWPIRSTTALRGGYRPPPGSAAISALAFQPGGEALYSAGADGELRHWPIQPAAGETQGRVIGRHGSAVNSLAFLDAGTTLVSSGRNDAPKLWALDAQREFAREPRAIAADTAPPMAASLDPGGHWLVVIDFQGHMRLWRVDETGQGLVEQITNIDETRLRHARFSDRGNRLLLYGWDRRVWVLDLGDNDLSAPPRVLQGHESLVTHGQFSVSGRWLATRDLHGRTKLWDLTADDGAVRPLDLGRGVLAFSAGETRIIQASQPGRLQVWRLEKGSVAEDRPLEYPDMPAAIHSLAISADHRRIASISSAGQMQIWTQGSPAGTTAAGTLNTSIADLRLRFSEDSRWLAADSQDGRGPVRVWSVADGEPVVVFQADGGNLAFQSEHRWMLHYGHQRMPTLVDLESAGLGNGTNGHELPVSCSAVMAAAFHGEQRLTTFSLDGTLRQWDLNQPKPWNIATGLSHAPFKAATLTVSNGVQHLWSAGRNLVNLVMPDRDNLGCTFPTASRTLSSTGAAPILLHAVANGKELLVVRFDGKGEWLSLEGDQHLELGDRLDFHLQKPTGTRKGGQLTGVLASLAGAAASGKAGLLGSAGGKTSTSAVNLLSAAWSEQAQTAALLETPRQVSLWRIRGSNPKKLRDINWPQELNAAGLSLSPSGQWLALGFDSGVVGLMDLQAAGDSEGMILLRGHRKTVRQLSFNPQERNLATGSDDGSVRLWDIGLDELSERACAIAGRDLHADEWLRYIGKEDYRPVCSGLDKGRDKPGE